jgi:sec-independent protein translocase protein TatA
MFAGLASPSHLIIVLVLVLLFFGAKRIPDLAKGLGTGIKELREGISTGDGTEAEASETEDVHSVGARAGAGNETVCAHAGQRDL